MVVLAHVGHWLASLIYVAPALLLAGVLLVSALKERRRRARAGQPQGPQA